MTQITKCVSLLFLLALLTSPTALFAQDTETINIVGSGIVNSVVESLAEANETDSINIETTGTSAGFEQFCAGTADVVTATRAISADEDANCISNEIAYGELLVAHSILAFGAHPSVSLQCLTPADFNTLFTPSAAGQVTNWSIYDETIEDLPITFILPQDNTVEYVILDSLVDGDGLRRDGETYTDVEDVINQLSDTEGAIAVLPYSTDLTVTESIVVLDVNYNTTTGCASPSAANVENRLYTVAQPLFIYVNRASLDANEALDTLVSFATSADSSEDIVDAGFVAPTEETYALNADILANVVDGRLFSGTDSSFTVPENLVGQININGSANAYNLLNTTAAQLAGNNQQLVVNVTAEGQATGIRRLCNGETDIAVLQSDSADVDWAGCEANNINTIPVSIGTQAVVLVGNNASSDVSCLTSEQINTIWGSSSAETVMNWSDVDSEFPDQDMTLFGLSTLNQYSDILLSTGEGAIEPIRRDTELSNDALYRAAAVGNVEGALTYMSWTDYRRVQANNQGNIQLLSVDNGDGCILPTEGTITDGTYPLSRTANLLVSEASLADINVQSLVWRLFSDQGWTTIEREGFIGIDFGDLPAIRSSLETEFSLAETNVAANPVAESTEEPDAEAEEADESSETEDSD